MIRNASERLTSHVQQIQRVQQRANGARFQWAVHRCAVVRTSRSRVQVYLLKCP
jgi:hypothetical protein